MSVCVCICMCVSVSACVCGGGGEGSDLCVSNCRLRNVGSEGQENKEEPDRWIKVADECRTFTPSSSPHLLFIPCLIR